MLLAGSMPTRKPRMNESSFGNFMPTRKPRMNESSFGNFSVFITVSQDSCHPARVAASNQPASQATSQPG